MAGKQAKVLARNEIRKVLKYLGHKRYPHRGRIAVMLSAYAGLRAKEIGGFEWGWVLTASGSVGNVIELPNRSAKKNGGRSIPLHPELRQALIRQRRREPDERFVIRSERGGAMTAASVVNWFRRVYDAVGLQHCSSHSGRRTFITNLARNAHLVGGCLRDAQILAGHKSISQTQRYIDGDTNAQRRLVRLI